MVDSNRRRFVGIAGTALLTGFAGCSYFEDDKGVPGRDEVPDESGETPDAKERGDETRNRETFASE